MNMPLKDHKESGYGMDFESLPRTKAEAAAIGVSYFFTGRACKNGHIAARYTKGGTCSFCIRIRNAKKRGVIVNSYNDAMAYAIANQVRKSAHSEGQITYVPSKPCKNGHFIRWVSSNNCVECDKEMRIKYALTKKERRIEKTYGMTVGEHKAMFDKQGGMCLICNRSHSDRFEMHVDHCHKTLRVRGLLCQRCNQAIGLFCEDPSVMMAAAEYVND